MNNVQNNADDFAWPQADAMMAFTAPLRAYFSPRYFGLNHVDRQKPTLFVANHTLYGVLDIPIYVADVYHQRNVLMRPLLDPQQFEIPLWRDVLAHMGALPDREENLVRLLAADLHVLVFPGGGREACKRKGEKYKLMWGDRIDFIRVAIQHGYDIIPVASVGGDHAFDILFDADDLLSSPLGQWLRTTPLKQKLKNGWQIPAVSRGLGLSLLPRPERFYISFGRPIDTRRLAGKQDDATVCWQVREEVAAALSAQMAASLLYREQDTPSQSLLRRIFKKL